MSRWLRLHTEVVDDPKVQCLPPELFRAWINVLCIAGQNGGKLPDMRAVAFKLRMGEADARKTLEGLEAAGLLDRTEEGFEPHAWKERQYQGATSTDRVKKHRAKAKDETPDETVCNVSETFHETSSETKNETHQKQTQNRSDIISFGARDAAEIGKEVCRLAGVPEGRLATQIFEVHRWLNNGWDAAKDIIPAIEAMPPEKRQGKNLAYFTPVIASFIATRDAPIEAGNARASPSVPKMTGAELAAENERKRNAILARTN